MEVTHCVLGLEGPQPSALRKRWQKCLPSQGSQAPWPARGLPVPQEAWIHGKLGGHLLGSVWDSRPLPLGFTPLSPKDPVYTVGITMPPGFQGPCEARVLHLRVIRGALKHTPPVPTLRDTDFTGMGCSLDVGIF